MAIVPRRKYGNVTAYYRGERYDSHGEATYAQHLDALKATGRIRDWQRGKVWVLVDAPKARDRITYRPDFEVWDAAGFRVIDYKGMLTDVFRLKAKLWKAVRPDIPLYIVKADGTETLA